MADGKIYITISDNRKSGDKPSPSQINNKKEENDKDSLFSDYLKVQFSNFLKQQINQQINYSIQNIGNFTGDYQSQREINNAIGALGVVSNIAMGAIAGAKYGGVYGAIAGAVIATGSQALSFIRSENSANFAINKQNREIAILRDVSGLNQLTNGSRGTNE